jgi:hypothetical protein
MPEENVEILKKVNDVLIHEPLYNDLKKAADEQGISVGNLISDFIHREAPVQLNI